MYPGGSSVNPDAVGFSWLHNYWCNLDNPIAINGEPNPARPFALTATIILCFSLAAFFYQFATTTSFNTFWRNLVKIFGITSMFVASFITTDFHDIALIIASVLGLIALISVVKGMIINKMNTYLYLGVFCIMLMAVNNFIYYTNYGVYYLPVIQKISFLLVLTWVAALSLSLKTKPVY